MVEKSSAGVVLVALLLAGLLLILPMFGMNMWGRMMMGGWGCPAGMGWRFMFAGMPILLFFIVLIAVGAYFLLTHRGKAGENGKALAILNERYAKGEITKEQYLEAKQQLTSK